MNSDEILSEYSCVLGDADGTRGTYIGTICSAGLNINSKPNNLARIKILSDKEYIYIEDFENFLTRVGFIKKYGMYVYNEYCKGECFFLLHDCLGYYPDGDNTFAGKVIYKKKYTKENFQSIITNLKHCGDRLSEILHRRNRLKENVVEI